MIHFVISCDVQSWAPTNLRIILKFRSMKKVSGYCVVPYAAAMLLSAFKRIVSGSSVVGQSFFCPKSFVIGAHSLSTLMATTSSPASRFIAAANLSSGGSSVKHGGHQLAQKLSRIG